MSSFNTEELISFGNQEEKVKHKKTSLNGSAKRLPYDYPVIHHGESIGVFYAISEGQRCDCPEGHLHSDGLGDDYAHTIRLTSGDVAISCSGNSCSKLFIPEIPRLKSLNISNKKLDIGQLDAYPLLHFNEALLPEPLKRWTLDNCMHAEGSLNYGIISAIVVCANLIGVKCQIKPKRHGDWKLTPNLWGMIIGEPSKRKSPVVEQFLKPLKKMEIDSSENFKSRIRQYEEEKIEHDIAQKAKTKELQKAYESGDKTKIANAKSICIPILEEPKMERFIINDATTEKIGEIMSNNPRTLLCYRDELSGFFSSLKKAGREGDRAFYLESFSGDSPYTSDRIGRGTIHIEKLSLGLFGTIQPSILAKYIISSNGNSGDGLAQRMQLAVFPDEDERLYYDEPIDQDAKDVAYMVIERLSTENYETLLGAIVDENCTPFFEFNDTAQLHFTEWYNTMKQKERSEPNINVQAHIGKYYGLVPSLALVFFLIDKVAGLCDATAILPKYLELSIQWADVLESHARKMYGLSFVQNNQSLKQKIIEYVVANHHELPQTYGEISGKIRGAKAKDIEDALLDVCQIENRKVIKLK